MTKKLKIRVARQLDEKKRDCFQNKTFAGKASCIEDQKNIPKERANAYVASTLRKTGELDERQLSDVEKMTMDDILSDNDVISFDFDNTLIKSYPDYADDGSVFYANGGSNASMRRLIID